MIQTLNQIVSADEFLDWYPNNGIRYELHNGVIAEMPPPSGSHENVIGFLVEEIVIQYKRMGWSYSIPKTAFIKASETQSVYSPDILLLNREQSIDEPLWQKESTVNQHTSIPLVVEVVSTNWRDDYYKKYADYEALGIPEYWIVDYAALGGNKFLGKPK